MSFPDQFIVVQVVNIAILKNSVHVIINLAFNAYFNAHPKPVKVTPHNHTLQSYESYEYYSPIHLILVFYQICGNILFALNFLHMLSSLDLFPIKTGNSTTSEVASRVFAHYSFVLPP